MRGRRIVRGLLLCLTACLLSGCGKVQKAYQQGMKLYEDGAYEEALACFEEAVSANPEKAEYVIGYGMTLVRLSRCEQAEEVFLSAVQETENKISQENNKQLYYGLAMAAYDLGEYEAVVGYCESAEAVSYLAGMDCDILYTQACAQYCLGEYELAQELCQKMIETDAAYMDAYMLLADLQGTLGQSVDAVQTCLAAIEADKTYYDAYFVLYEQYVASGQTDAAQELLTQLISLKTNKADNLLVIGRAYLYREEYSRAAEFFRMAYEDGNSQSLYYLGVAKQAQEELDSAASYYKQYLETDSTDKSAESYSRLAQIYMTQEDYTAAREVLTEGLGLGSTSAAQELRRLQVILYERQADYTQALTAAQEYLKLYPSDTQMETELAFIKTRIR